MDKAMKARIRARKRRYYLYRLKILFWKWLALILSIWVIYQLVAALPGALFRRCW